MTDVDSAQPIALQAIARRYARVTGSGTLVRCQDRHAKVIYDGLDVAQWSALEMFSITGVRQRAYRCKAPVPDGETRHFHLRTENR